MAYISKYKATLDHYPTVEVRQKGMDTAVSSIMIWWPKIYPKVLGVFRLRDLKDLMEVMRDKGARDNFRGLRPGWGKIEGLLKLRDTFASVDNNLVFYLGEVISKPTDVEYLRITVLRSGWAGTNPPHLKGGRGVSVIFLHGYPQT